MFGKLKKDEKKELEELRKKNLDKMEDDIKLLMKGIVYVTNVIKKNKDVTEESLVELLRRVERLEDKEVDKVIDNELDKMIQ